MTLKPAFSTLAWHKKKIHISWCIATLSFGIVLGVALVSIEGTYVPDKSWVITGLCLAAIGMLSRASFLIPVILIAGMLVGLWRGSIQSRQLEQFTLYHNSSAVIKGKVSADPSYGTKGDLRFTLSNIEISSNFLEGTIWVSSKENIELKRGDIIEVSGAIKPGFGTISASMFQADIVSVQRPVPGDVGRQIRDWFAKGVQGSMPQLESQLALAFLVGQKLTVSETFNEQLRTVGLVHAVVASGYHLTVIVNVIRRLFVRVSKYVTFVTASGLAAGFILITGFSPSMTRAGIVTGLGLIAWYYGRRIHPLVLLPFAAAITVIYKPEYVWGDIGWYLSFTAFAGVLILAPLIHSYFWGTSVHPGLLREVIVATIAAQVATLPILLLVFGYYSPYALLANILVVPLIPLTMLLTFTIGLVGLVSTGLGAFAGLPITWVLGYIIKVVEWIASLPAAKVAVAFNVWWLIIMYCIITVATVILWRVTKHDFRANDQKANIL